jgi:hypothetical protein
MIRNLVFEFETAEPAIAETDISSIPKIEKQPVFSPKRWH